MSDKDLPAFPSQYVKHKRMEVGNEAPIIESSSGMTLRDYFAAKAMQAFWFDPESTFSAKKENAAEWSYAMADAMLEARKA